MSGIAQDARRAHESMAELALAALRRGENLSKVDWERELILKTTTQVWCPRCHSRAPGAFFHTSSWRATK